MLFFFFCFFFFFFCSPQQTWNCEHLISSNVVRRTFRSAKMYRQIIENFLDSPATTGNKVKIIMMYDAACAMHVLAELKRYKWLENVEAALKRANDDDLKITLIRSKEKENDVLLIFSHRGQQGRVGWMLFVLYSRPRHSEYFTQDREIQSTLLKTERFKVLYSRPRDSKFDSVFER